MLIVRGTEDVISGVYGVGRSFTVYSLVFSVFRVAIRFGLCSSLGLDRVAFSFFLSPFQFFTADSRSCHKSVLVFPTVVMPNEVFSLFPPVDFVYRGETP